MNEVINAYSFSHPVAEELKILENTMLEELGGYDPTLIAAATHLMNAGGKRIRPVMALLCSKATSSEPLNRFHYLLAMAVEILHTATLIHDDIIDGSQTRRGLPTVNREWGQRVSVLAGDFLLARSCFYISKIEKIRLNTAFSEMVMDMCNGEMSQFRRRYKSTMTLAKYLEQIESKTALLMSVGCRGAAMINGTSMPMEDALANYGCFVGMAFQIMDDILDFSISEAELGKSACNDLASGQVTLPTYYALQTSKYAGELKEAIDREMGQEGDLARSLQIVMESDALLMSQNLATEYRDKAKEQLNLLEPSAAKDALGALADTAIARRS